MLKVLLDLQEQLAQRQLSLDLQERKALLDQLVLQERLALHQLLLARLERRDRLALLVHKEQQSQFLANTLTLQHCKQRTRQAMLETAT